MVVTMKNAIFWDVMPCGCCKNRCSGGTYRLHHQGDKNQRARNNVRSNFLFLHIIRHLLVTANMAPSSLNLVTLMMEPLHSTKTLVVTRVTWCNIPEYGFLQVIGLFQMLFIFTF
jgi:hypothetical protein